jgi:hypothetical protein
MLNWQGMQLRYPGFPKAIGFGVGDVAQYGQFDKLPDACPG